MKRIFVSHPLTGNEVENRKDAARIVQQLSASYDEISFVNPLDLFQSVAVTEEYVILARCMTEIQKCDMVIQCSGWEASRGCVAEAAFAKMQHIPLMTLSKFIATYQVNEQEKKNKLQRLKHNFNDYLKDFCMRFEWISFIVGILTYILSVFFGTTNDPVFLLVNYLVWAGFVCAIAIIVYFYRV